jgi:thioredoxin
MMFFSSVRLASSFQILLLGALLAGCINQNAGTVNAQTGGAVPATVFKAVLDSLNHPANGSVQLIDVRTPEEYQREHIEGSKLIVFNSGNYEQRLRQLDANRPVLVYCLSGGRSGQAAQQLRGWGVGTVYELQGGLLQWRAAGLPLRGTAVQATATPEPARPTQAGKVSPDAYAQLIRQPGKLVLVDVYATWCGPCRMMDPHLKALAAEQATTLALVKVDADASRELATQLDVAALPTLLLYRDGQLIERKMGYQSLEQLKQWVATHSR